MTVTERGAALAALGWSQRYFAGRIGYNESSVRRWFRIGADAPPDIDLWLAAAGGWMMAHPPPCADADRPAGRPRKLAPPADTVITSAPPLEDSP